MAKTRTRERSGAFSGADAGNAPPWAKRLVQVLAADVYEAVEKGEAGNIARFSSKSSKVVKAVKNKLKSKKSRKELAVTGVVMGSGMVVTIVAAGVVTALTGGVALGIFAAIAAGGYAFKKLLKLGLRQRFCKPRTRNWLMHYKGAFSMNAEEYGRALTEDAGDAMRRLTDRYRRCRSAYARLEARLAAMRRNQARVLCCDEAILLVDLMGRFVHELDKCRNYLMPCLDLQVFMLIHQVDTANAWNGANHGIEGALLQHVMAGDHSHCSEVCYAPRHAGGQSPSKRLLGATGAYLRDANRTVGELGRKRTAIDLLNQVAEADAEIERALRDQEGRATGHRQAVEAARGRLVNSGSGFCADADRRLERLYGDVIGKVQHRNVGIRVGHGIKNWYRRTTKREKVLFGVSEVIDLGAVGLSIGLEGEFAGKMTQAFIKVLDATYSEADSLKLGIKSGTSLVTGVGLLIGGIVAEGDDVEEGQAAQKKLDQGKTDERIKHGGFAAIGTFQGIAEAALDANACLKKLAKVEGLEVLTCDEAMGAVVPAYEFVHNLDLMWLRTLESQAFLSILTDDVLRWTEYETRAWREVHEAAAAWMLTGDHAVCRDEGQHCYGAGSTEGKIDTGATPAKPI